jgi:hypothetical protein
MAKGTSIGIKEQWLEQIDGSGHWPLFGAKSRIALIQRGQLKCIKDHIKKKRITHNFVTKNFQGEMV